MTEPADEAFLELQREYLAELPARLDELRADLAAFRGGQAEAAASLEVRFHRLAGSGKAEQAEQGEARIGEQGSALSAGQAQRVALARAFYRDPFLVVLDEPNSRNLNSEGEEALTRAILSVRERKGIVVVVAHRQSAIAGVDRLLMMNMGRAQAIGPKDEVLTKVLQRPLAIPRPLKVVPESGSAGA